MIQRKSNQITKIWVHNDFKKWFKSESAKKGKSMVEFSREFAPKSVLNNEKRFEFKF